MLDFCLGDSTHRHLIWCSSVQNRKGWGDWFSHQFISKSEFKIRSSETQNKYDRSCKRRRYNRSLSVSYIRVRGKSCSESGSKSDSLLNLIQSCERDNFRPNNLSTTDLIFDFHGQSAIVDFHGQSANTIPQSRSLSTDVQPVGLGADGDVEKGFIFSEDGCRKFQLRSVVEGTQGGRSAFVGPPIGRQPNFNLLGEEELEEDRFHLFQRCLNEGASQIPESSESPPLREELFTNVLKPDRNGRVRTYGLGPCPSQVFGTRFTLSQEQRVKDQLRAELRAELGAELRQEVLRDVNDEITQLKNQYATVATYMKSAGHPLPPSPNGAGNGDGDHTPSLIETMDRDHQAEPFVSQELEENIVVRDEQVGWVTRKRKVGRPRSQPQQQQVSTHDTTHSTSHPSSSSTSAQANTMSNSCLTISKSSGSKHGRGKSLGIKGWGSGNKLKVQFDVNNKPLGDEGNSLTGQLGIMVRNSYRVPLTYLNWKSVPNHIKEGIWKEVQDNLEFYPDEYESVCMDSCRIIYKDNKAKIKADHYTSYMFSDADPNIALRVPDFVDPDQWKELVEYWQIEEVEAEALHNKGNRSWRGTPHNIGRTPFSQIRYDLAANGENLDKMSVYLQTRRQDNPEVKDIMFPDATSGHRTVRDHSIGGDTPTLERGHRTPTRSPGPVEQVIEKEMDDY
ncbi:hypothetical protein RHGRI_004877 [Rhododendron griersonianum]|uniref:Uncharacterized protein n=1 Tax=Rhododendron griersonianum TaxID=479676 RepID=A0AAV6LDJ1_9ERIC|nr:hypothetical protein RHGRI_004877 [Rhododendron griersonianum]